MTSFYPFIENTADFSASSRLGHFEASSGNVSESAAQFVPLWTRESAPIPQVAADGWALHGRVYSSDLKPHAKYTVFLVDGQKPIRRPSASPPPTTPDTS